MKSSEVRIGNYVQDVISGEWMIVDEIGEKIGLVVLNRDKFPLPDGWRLEPIPLTHEILEKAGFYQIEEEANHWFDRLGNLFFKYNDVLGDYRYHRVDGGATSVKHLHQLQNLYFYLTGEELTINL